MRAPSLLLATSLLTLACEAEDPVGTVPDASPVDSAIEAGDVALDGDAPTCTPTEVLEPTLDNPSCKPKSGDYAPGSADDGWPVCISDDGLYHRFDASISTIARVDAFERIAAKLGFGSDRVPTPDDFLQARIIYTEPEGLESRVSRREDEHYPPAPKACRDLSPAELATHADRCAGPAKIQPLLNDAFAKGASGVDPALQAVRIEAALLWFLYISPFKEARTCTEKVNDCDSSYAYYTGGDPRDDGKGFARYVRRRSKQAHDAIWNGILAVRCWRDLDNPTGTASNLPLRDRAVSQLDRAMHRGLAVIVRQRITRRLCGVSWQGTRILGAALDREATARDPAKAAILRAQLAKDDPATVEEKAVFDALDALFACPW